MMKYSHQVISYNKRALRCHDQIRSLGYFFTARAAHEFAKSFISHGAEIIVRPAK